MKIDASLIEQLLHEEESSELDFKRDQYKFIRASEDEKSELLKDILAFANAWRRTDAFILVGVEEIKGDRCNVVGIAQDLDDSDLQQFVNAKTNQPIDFAYRVIAVKDKHVGVIHIPIQSRPIYLTKHYGKLKSGVVYLRRGTSTTEATPTEIASMGRIATMANDLQLRIAFYPEDSRELLSSPIHLESLRLKIPLPSEIPDYREIPANNYSYLVTHARSEYYRELAKYVRVMKMFKGIKISVHNASGIPAHDVRVLISIPDPDAYLKLESHLPSPPAQRSDPIRPMPFPYRLPDVGRTFFIEEEEGVHQVEVLLGKIQPQDTALPNHILYLSSRQDCMFRMSVKIYADNLPQPLALDIDLEISVTNEDASLERIIELDQEIFNGSAIYRNYLRDSERDQ